MKKKSLFDLISKANRSLKEDLELLLLITRSLAVFKQERQLIIEIVNKYPLYLLLRQVYTIKNKRLQIFLSSMLGIPIEQKLINNFFAEYIQGLIVLIEIYPYCFQGRLPNPAMIIGISPIKNKILHHMRFYLSAFLNNKQRFWADILEICNGKHTIDKYLIGTVTQF